MWMWAVPAAVIVVAAVPLAVLLRRISAEAAELVDELARVRDLRPALVELRDDARVVRGQLHQLRSR